MRYRYDPIGNALISIIGFGPIALIFTAHCHNYYHCFTETGIRWRNWRRKVRYFDYHSIYKVTYEQTSKNGWAKIRSTQLPKHIKLGFDTNQFDATILYAQLQCRLETGAWVQQWEDERFQQILSGRPGVRFLQDHAWVKPLEFPRENGQGSLGSRGRWALMPPALMGSLVGVLKEWFRRTVKDFRRGI